MSAVGAAGLAPWPLGRGLGFSAGMRRRLPLAGPQRGFHFPAQPLDLLLQALGFVPKALGFVLEPFDLLLLLDLPLGSVEFLPGNKLAGVRRLSGRLRHAFITLR